MQGSTKDLPLGTRELAGHVPWFSRIGICLSPPVPTIWPNKTLAGQIAGFRSSTISPSLALSQKLHHKTWPRRTLGLVLPLHHAMPFDPESRIVTARVFVHVYLVTLTASVHTQQSPHRHKLLFDTSIRPAPACSAPHTGFLDLPRVTFRLCQRRFGRYG